jgi:hypothetical protein
VTSRKSPKLAFPAFRWLANNSDSPLSSMDTRMELARTFPIRFQGQWLECHTPQDAATVQRADDIIC